MFDSAALGAFVVAAVVICVVPGPDQLFILASTMRHGNRGGVAAAVGMSIGMGVHTTAAVVGLSALIRSSAVAFEAIRITGALYLLWLAISAFRAGPRPDRGNFRASTTSLVKICRQAAITNLLNPKIAIFFLAFLPQFVDARAGNVAFQLLVLGVIFTFIGLIVDVIVALVSGSLKTRARGSVRFNAWLERFAGTIYLALAVRLATDR